jgi:CysZ protein
MPASLAGVRNRTIGVNLLVLPLALILLFTVFGAPLAFWLANSVLLGRELTDMVWLRYRQTVGQDAPVRRWERLALGGIATALLSVPLANLFAPFIGAAMATHLIHRKGFPAHAA